ncbi:MAG: glutamate--tRNA ligase family protein [Ilumatobacteraceae bacterium]
MVDDELQGVDQVVRGDDLASSTPRQILLQQLLGFERPEYQHVPLVLGPTGRRLAKATVRSACPSSPPRVDGARRRRRAGPLGRPRLVVRTILDDHGRTAGRSVRPVAAPHPALDLRRAAGVPRLRRRATMQ